jgi:hypothetical protein
MLAGAVMLAGCLGAEPGAAAEMSDSSSGDDAGSSTSPDALPEGAKAARDNPSDGAEPAAPGSAVAAAASTGAAPTESEESRITDAATSASCHQRTVKFDTSDASPGGYGNATVTWCPKSNGRYSGSVDFELWDNEPDGYCVVGVAIVDGVEYQRGKACPAYNLYPALGYYDYSDAARVTAKICLYKDGKRHYCSKEG